MSDIDWTKPVEVKIAGNWLPVKAVLKDADGQLVLDNDGSVAFMPEKIHKTVLFLNPDRFRNTPPPKREPYEGWVVLSNKGVHGIWEIYGPAHDFVERLGYDARVIHMREVEPTDE